MMPDSTNTPALPYTDEERGDAWAALYERFGVIPVPTEQIWKTQADLTRAMQALSEACKERDEFRIALSLACELHGCASDHCAPSGYLGDAEKLWTELAEARKELIDWTEREAMCCPEDVGFDEFIATLRKKIEAQAAEIATLREKDA